MADDTLNTATTCDFRGVARRVPKGMLCPDCSKPEGIAYCTRGIVQYRKCRTCGKSYQTDREANTVPTLVRERP